MSVQFLVFLQHLDELLNPLLASLGLFSALNSKKDGISVTAIQSGKKGFSTRISIQFCLKIAGHCRGPGRVIRPIPASISPGELNRLKPCRCHLAGFDKLQRFLSIDL